MLSAVITSACTALVTTAGKGNEAIAGLFSIVNHGIAAGEHIAKAVEGRAEIYGTALVKNGGLAEREQTLKHELRLRALELQDQSAGTKPQPVKVKPATKGPKRKPAKVKSPGRSMNAASTRHVAATPR